MIIQRIASALRRQDWTQVVIEIFIVIVGIFLGLQVQAWYERQQAIEEEKRLIAYFITDLERNNEILGERHLFMENQVVKGYGVLEILKSDEFSEEDRAIFEEGVSIMARTQGLDDYLNSLNEANIDKVLNIDLRQVLDGYLGYLKRSNGVASNIKTTMFNVMTYVRGNSGMINSNEREYVTTYDIDALKNDSQYKASVTSAVHGMAQFQNRLNSVRENSQMMIEILKKYQSGQEFIEVDFQ